MRLPFRCRPAFAATFAAWLAASSACSDAAAPTTGDQTSPSGATLIAAVPAVEVAVGSSVVVDGSFFYAGSDGSFTASIMSSSPGPATVALQPLGPRAVRIVGLEAGTAIVRGSAGLVSSRLAVTVLPLTSQPPTLVAVDFRMFEVPTGASTWSYVPQLVLRDSSVREGSAVIAARFDMPALAGPLPSCAMNRPIGLFADVPIFHALYYDEYEIMIGRSDRSATGEVVAHLTVRTPEGTAATLILRGPIDQGAIPANYGGTPVSASAMWLTCG